MTDPSEASEEPKKIIIDEDWKSQVQAEKEAQRRTAPPETPSPETPSAETFTTAAADGRRGPAATFPMLVNLLATSASFALSPVDDAGKPAPPELVAAKHYIDLLGVLEEKTKGNLSADESRLLGDVLHDLRMAYVTVKKR